MAFDNDDILKNLKKMMDANFKGFFNFDEPFDQDEIKLSTDEKDPKEMKKNAKKLNPSAMKSYSISYKFGTGMDKPEVKVSGDVDPDMIKQFLAGMPTYNFPAELTGKRINLLKPKLNRLEEDSNSLDPETSVEREVAEDHSVKRNEIAPFYDINSNEKGATITLEMPGIATEDVKTELHKDYITIRGVNGDRNYKQKINLDFQPVSISNITAKNGIITVEITK